MKKSTRVLSLLLVLVMVFALMPTFTVEAKAEENINWQNSEIANTRILQFEKELESTKGEWNSRDDYKLTTVQINRHTLYPESQIESYDTQEGIKSILDRGYGDSNIFLIPRGQDVQNYMIVRDQKADYRGAYGKTDISRWWRWKNNNWVNDSEWVGGGKDGMYARIFGRTSYTDSVGVKHVTTSGTSYFNVPKTTGTWTGEIKGKEGTYNRWVGGNEGQKYYTASNQRGAGRVYITIDTDLDVGKKGVLLSANGTAHSKEAAHDFCDQEWVRPGDIGTHTFAIAERSTVIYRLNGGTWDGKEQDVGFYTWSTGDASTAQLHDIIDEPTREGYTFLGWRCLKTDAKGNSGLTVGGVYQPFAVYHQKDITANSAKTANAVKLHSHDYDGKPEYGCVAITDDTEFEAVWVKNEIKIAHVQKGELNAALTETKSLTDFGGYKVVANDKIKEFESNDNTLDLISKVPAGYLYGGTFEDDYETVADFNGGTAKSFVPEFTEEGTTYYIWEVPVQHLQPTILGVFEKEGGNYNVVEAYAASAIDRVQYQEAGFIVDGNKYISKDSDTKALFEKIGVKSTKSGGARDYTYNKLNPKFTDVKSDALLSCIKFPVPATGSPTTVVPYWITLDGQTVYGIKQATVQYNNAGPDYINMALTVTYQDYPVVPKSFAAPRMNAAPMMLMSTFSMNSNATPEPDEIGETIVPDEPEVPVVPDEPEVPDVPEEPEVPDVPEEPEVPVVPESKPELTVSDGANVYEVEITDDLALTPAGQDGKLFAGWFTDPACTVAADLSAVEDGDAVFAKYVSNKYLQVKYNATFTLLSKTVSLTSAVDGKNFAETGYVISTKNGDKTVVVNKYATKFALQDAKQLFGATKGAPLMNVDYKLSGLSKNDTVTITPYWITADGTTVFGTARTLTYTGLTIRG